MTVPWFAGGQAGRRWIRVQRFRQYHDIEILPNLTEQRIGARAPAAAAAPPPPRTANLTACILVLLACSACRAGGGARACAGR
eukprot:COSAG01_NODE_1071_length_11863_cov_36.887623_1_plen_82_part_10